MVNGWLSADIPLGRAPPAASAYLATRGEYAVGCGRRPVAAGAKRAPARAAFRYTAAMKSQLLQDIGENGGRPPAARVVPPQPAPAPAAAPEKRAVWRRPQLDDAGRLRGEAALPPYRPPPPPPPPPPPAQPEAAPTPPPVRDPDWLAGRLQQAAAEHGESSNTHAWTRRAVAWGLGGALLAAMVAGGWWAVEEQRVTGALAVVAKTEPQPGAVAAAVTTPQPDVPPPVGNPPLRVPDPPAQAPPPAPALAPAEPAPSPAPAADPIASRQVATVDIDPPPRPRAHPRPKPHVARAPIPAHKPAPAPVRAAAGPSPRQQREETLLQCRAWGYNERQCVARGCQMTRFGLACRG